VASGGRCTGGGEAAYVGFSRELTGLRSLDPSGAVVRSLLVQSSRPRGRRRARGGGPPPPRRRRGRAAAAAAVAAGVAPAGGVRAAAAAAAAAAGRRCRRQPNRTPNRITVGQQANRRPSVGAVCSGTNAEQNAIPFGATVGLSREGAVHVPGPEARNGSHPRVSCKIGRRED